MKSAILELCPDGLATRTLVRDGETKQIVCVTEVKIRISKETDFYSYEFTILRKEGLGPGSSSEEVVSLPGEFVELVFLDRLKDS